MVMVTRSNIATPNVVILTDGNLYTFTGRRKRKKTKQRRT